MTKEEAEKKIKEKVSGALPCPFCGKIPTFDIMVGDQSNRGSTIHQASRVGCCKATGMGQTEIFFTNNFKSPDYNLWSWMAIDLVNDWNTRIK